MGADLATVIADARRAAGLSQAQLARRAGISASYLSRIESAAWERGGPWPADSVLRALARTLGISSTQLVALRRAARAGQAEPRTRGGSRTPYAVSIGADAVDSAARNVVARNPADGVFRSAQVITSGAGPSYLDALGAAMAARPHAILYRVCATDRRHLRTAPATMSTPAGENVRTRVPFGNPLVLDVLIGDHEVFLAVPDRRGHPYLRAGIVIDDPDFVRSMQDWFDESVWDPPSGYADVRGQELDEPLSGPAPDLDPRAPFLIGPRAHG